MRFPVAGTMPSRFRRVLQTLAATLSITASVAAAQAPAPVWNASGYGAVMPIYHLGNDHLVLARRSADAGGPAELTLLSPYPAITWAERWRVTADGVPCRFATLPLRGHGVQATWMDVDGDGMSDLVCAEYVSGALSLEAFRSTATGLQSPGALSVSSDLQGNMSAFGPLLLADVDGDGRQDVGVVSDDNSYNNRTVWFLGTGHSTFTALVKQSTTSIGPVAVARLGAESRSSAFHTREDRVERWTSDGNGKYSFDPDFPYGLPADGPSVLADVDGDGFTEVIAGRYLYRGTASGLEPTYMDLGASVSLAGDVDADGHMDLLAVNPGSLSTPGLLGIAKGDGAAGFAPFEWHHAGSVSALAGWTHSFTWGLQTLGDLNADGRADLAYFGGNSRELDVLPGIAGGTFFEPIGYPTETGPVQVELADVSGDGRADVLDLARGARRLEWRAGWAGGTFGPAQAIELPAGARRFAVGDLDGDGYPDVAVASDSALSLCMVPGGPGGFGARLDFAVTDSLSDVSILDLDEDGQLDVVAFSPTGRFFVWRGLGGWSFASSPSLPLTSKHRQFVDVDHDGHLDLVLMQTGTSAYDGNVRLLRGDGHGSFQNAPGMFSHSWATWAFSKGTVPWAGDLFGDGAAWLALAVRDSVGPNSCFLRGWQLSDTPPDSEFPDPPQDDTYNGERGYELPASPVQMRIAEVTGDGIPDVVVLSDLCGSLTVLPGLGNARFGTPVTHLTGPSPSSFALGDVDGDGLLDAIVANAGSNDLLVLRHRGTTPAAVTGANAVRRLALSISRSPGGSHFTAHVALSGDMPARLDVFDLQGRRLSTQRIVSPATGERSLELDARAVPRGSLALVRLRQAGASATAKLVRY